MKRGRWFLPESPDVLGQLRRQAAITIEGLDAFVAWAGGDADAAHAVRAASEGVPRRDGRAARAR